jgi:hypothetical protein
MLELQQGHAVEVGEDYLQTRRSAEVQRHGGMKTKRPSFVCPRLCGDELVFIIPSVLVPEAENFVTSKNVRTNRECL